MCKIVTENAEEIGDLYLDIAEAYVDKGMYKKAKPLLHTLVNTEDYNLVGFLSGKFVNFLLIHFAG